MAGGLATSIQAAAADLAKDEGSRKLYLRDGKSLPTGEKFCNPELADTLIALSKRGTVESFYRGDIAHRIAEAFQKNGGLVTVKDLNTQAQQTYPQAAAGTAILEALKQRG